MTVSAFQQADHHARRHWSQDFDPDLGTFVRTWTGDVDADTPEAACEFVFDMLNQADRPTARTAYSLSVGDTVAVGEVFYLCENVGFRRLDRPPTNLVFESERFMEIANRTADEVNRERS